MHSNNKKKTLIKKYAIYRLELEDMLECTDIIYKNDNYIHAQNWNLFAVRLPKKR